MRVQQVVVALALSFVAPGSRAGTMTFDALPGATDSPYEEDGITATSDHELGWFGTPGRAHLDDSGTGYPRSITFTMATRFKPVSFELYSRGYRYCPPGAFIEPCGTPYDNVRVSAYRDDIEVYLDQFSAGAPGTPYLFPDLEPIDQLRIGAVRPDNESDFGEEPTPEQGYCGGPPCSHFDIDNVTLVPEPILGTQAALGAAALGLRLWRRRALGAADSRPA